MKYSRVVKYLCVNYSFVRLPYSKYSSDIECLSNWNNSQIEPIKLECVKNKLGLKRIVCKVQLKYSRIVMLWKMLYIIRIKYYMSQMSITYKTNHYMLSFLKASSATYNIIKFWYLYESPCIACSKECWKGNMKLRIIRRYIYVYYCL